MIYNFLDSRGWLPRSAGVWGLVVLVCWSGAWLQLLRIYNTMQQYLLVQERSLVSNEILSQPRIKRSNGRRRINRSIRGIAIYILFAGREKAFGVLFPWQGTWSDGQYYCKLSIILDAKMTSEEQLLCPFTFSKPWRVHVSQHVLPERGVVSPKLPKLLIFCFARIVHC